MSVYSNRSPTCLHRPVSSWTREDVSSWLCFFGLSRFVGAFLAASVDGSKLPGLFMNPVAMERLGVVDDLDKQQLTMAIQPMMMSPPIEVRSSSEPSMLLRVVDSVCNETGREMVVTATGLRCGRSSESNDIVLLDTAVSRSHFTIHLEDGCFQLQDNASSLGTFLMVRDEVALRPDYVFQFGSSELQVVTVSDRMVSVQVTKGSCRQGVTVDLPGGVIGRDPAAQVSLAGDPQVSHKHAEVFERAGRWFLRDTESTNSTWRKLAASSPVPITTNDIFKIGGTVILVVEDLRPEVEPEPETEKETGPIREEDLCKICFDRSIDTVMIPCGHMVVCRFCGKKVKDCPICRKPFDGIIRTFKA